MIGRNGKELTRAGKIAWCANRATSRLKKKYYAEYNKYYEEELAAAGIEFNRSKVHLLLQENFELKQQLNKISN